MLRRTTNTRGSATIREDPAQIFMTDLVSWSEADLRDIVFLVSDFDFDFLFQSFFS